MGQDLGVCCKGVTARVTRHPDGRAQRPERDQLDHGVCAVVDVGIAVAATLEGREGERVGGGGGGA